MQISVVAMDSESAGSKGYLDWPTWERGVSRFPWHYDTIETCYIVRGRAVIETEDGKVEIEPGDLVTFPKGLDCVWNIREPLGKHYKLG